MNEELRNEIKRVIEKLKEYMNRLNTEKYFYDDIQDYCFPKGVFSYVVITAEGKEYILNCITREVPEINLDDIVCVIKSLPISSENAYGYWDTVNGYHDNWGLFNSTISSFNVKEVIGEFED